MKDTNIKFEDIQIKKISYKNVEKKIKHFIELIKNAEDFKEGYKVIKSFNKYIDNFVSNITVISIRYSLNTKDLKLQKIQEQVDELMPLIEGLIHEWNTILVSLPYRNRLEEKMSSYYFVMIENSLKSFDEKIIPELIECNKLSSEYDKVLGSAEISFNGDIYNLSQMGKFSESNDREIRKQASIAVGKFFEDNEETISSIYDKLVKQRTLMAQKLGYKNFVELGYLNLGRTDYNHIMVGNYRKQVAECVVPVAQKLYKKQAKRIGIPFSKMKSYDYNLNFLDGNPKPIGTEEVLIKAATNMYHDMSKESGEFFDLMVDRHLLDLTARSGKRPGGYMTFIPEYGYPFIFSNFNGTQGDVDVLTHEVGHALQGYLSRNIQPSALQSPTYEACEIHSMSMEFFAWPYMKDFFADDCDKYRYSHLDSAIKFLPYGITIDEFQHWVYENYDATHEERCAKFKEIQSRYSPHLNYEDVPVFEKGGYWMKQAHVFGSPFYYIDYTLAQVVAMQFLVEMKKNQEKAWKKYIKLSKCGGKYPFTVLLEKNKLRNPFIEGNVEKTIKPIVKLLKDLEV